ncbi:MAG: ABC transporter permease [Acidobacteria bacterium]|nr:ABC transporter permease [Acidobacteriota bacterium]
MRSSVDQILQDLRVGARILGTSPGLSATVIVLIALFIGGNITIYSMVRTLLTKPAPGVEADRLVVLSMTVNGRIAEPRFSHPDYLDFVTQSSAVRPLLSTDSRLFTLTVDSGSYALRGAAISTNFFETLGVRLARGRTFTDAESRLQRSGLVAVVSDRVWDEYFQRADDILGRHLTLNGHPAVIVGVAPPRFEGPLLGDAGLGVWVPAVAWARVQGSEAALDDRAASAGFIIGRLAPGRSLSQARAEFATISARLQAAFPQSKANTAITPIPYSMTAGGDSLFATQAPRFLAIFSVVTLITLAIVCANVANLLLARVVARQREMAVRRAMGASRARVVRLLIAEGATLSIVAWVAACGFAWWVSRAIIAFVAPPTGARNIFSYIDFTPDWHVAGYAMLLALAGTVAFTLAPASRARRQDPLPFLKAGEQGIVQGRSRLSSVLAVVQLAFAVLLLICAGLAYRSLSLIETADLGFEPEGILILAVNTAGSAPGPAEQQVLARSLRERLLTVPGVQAAAQVATVPPFGGIRSSRW